MRQTVIGIFNNTSEAQEAIQQLENKGFNRSNIDISQSGASGGTGSQDSYEEEKDSDSIGDFFGSLFGSKDEASKYSNVARNNECMVTVHANSSEEAIRAAEVLDGYGAVDIDEQASQYGDSKLERHLSESDRDETSIPIIEEHLEVGKKEVETGRTRIRSRIIERPVEESLRLRQEHVHVERNAVNRKASESELANFKETDMEITEHAEVPVVSKEARVVEEVRLEKDVDEHEETIRDTVRKTEVDVDHDDTDDERIDRNDDRY